jgi:hypothetical protein
VGLFEHPKDKVEQEWVQGWKDELEEAKRKWEVEMNDDTSEGDGKEVKVEDRDLTMGVKMEGSPSSMTATTEAEQFDGIVRDLNVGREVIIID